MEIPMAASRFPPGMSAEECVKLLFSTQGCTHDGTGGEFACRVGSRMKPRHSSTRGAAA